MSYRYIIVFTVISVIFILLDVYVWNGYKKTIDKTYFSVAKWLIPITSLLFIIGFMANLYRGSIGIHNAHLLINLIVGISLGFFIAKLISAAFFLIEDVYRVSHYLFHKFSSSTTKELTLTGRRNFVKNITLGVAALPVLGSIYAVTKGKYSFHIKQLDLFSKRLPRAFNGFKVVQFSDFHAGSFDDKEAVRRGLHLINEQNPDIIVFTGDLVNNRAVEMEPYIDLFKDLNAKHGKFAILGNHDYGDYIQFDSDEERQKNLDELSQIFKNTGFQLLNNEFQSIEIENEQIDIIGVENWGMGPFPKYGDLELATQNLPEDHFNILLSHDPDHWEYQIRKFNKHIDLTLSGHTHGSQVGVNIPGWKWSPVKYRYKRWLGHYHENDKHLFVSKGFGFLGFPGRIGMLPEIVSVTLYSEENKPV